MEKADKGTITAAVFFLRLPDNGVEKEKEKEKESD